MVQITEVVLGSNAWVASEKAQALSVSLCGTCKVVKGDYSEHEGGTLLEWSEYKLKTNKAPYKPEKYFLLFDCSTDEYLDYMATKSDSVKMRYSLDGTQAICNGCEAGHIGAQLLTHQQALDLTLTSEWTEPYE